MKAIILAAGQGTRLQSLTSNKPKCLVSLFGKSLLDWQLETFRKCGITDISVVRGYKGDLINKPGITYFENPKYDTTNMVETLFCAKKIFDDSIIVSYGDIIFQTDILQKLIDSKHDISVVVDSKWENYWKKRFENPLNDAESLSYDDEGNISSIGQKVCELNEIQGQYIGLIKFHKNIIEKILNYYEKLRINFSKQDNIPEFRNLYMTDFLQALINSGHVIKPVIIENGWLELDSVKDYELYNHMNENQTISNFIVLNNSVNNK